MRIPTSSNAAGAAPPAPPAVRLRCGITAAAALAGLTTIGCSLPLEPARMQVPQTLASAAPVEFDGLSGGRQGRFTLGGQPVQFRRMGDTLSVLDALHFDRVAVQFEHAGTVGRCDGRGTTATAGVVSAPLEPLELRCRFTGATVGEVTLREPPLAGAGTRRSRVGQASFGPLVLEIRSEHELQGSALPLPQPAGYLIQRQGRDIAALELTDTTPSWRHVAELDDPTRAALAQVVLALGLLFDPALTGP
jgi:hypothetical protein